MVKKLVNGIKQLKQYDKQYYSGGTSPLSDSKYDQFKEEVQKEFPDDPYFKTVGSPAINKKVKLPYILGSLTKKKISTIEKWMKENPGPYVYTEKIDGVSILVTYYDGEVISAYTRGNGEYGKDITDKAKVFCPPIFTQGKVVVRGDAVLFDKLNFKNRRNGVAGILNRDDLEQCKYIKPIFYECLVYKQLNIKSEYEEFVLLESMKLWTPEWKVVDAFNLTELIKFYEESKYKRYDVDGVVISINKNTREDVLFPKNKIAFKLQGEGISTTVEKIEWQVSRNGRVIPVVNVEPIEIDGSTVSKTTGFNAQYIEQEEIGFGTILKLVKSGDVIPYIIEVENVNKPTVNLPEYCPSCGSFLEWKGVDLICKNNDCGDKSFKSMEYFTRTLGAENITEKTLKKLNVKNIIDLYSLTEKDIVQKEGFAERKAEQVVSEIKRTLHNTQTKVLTAFGIPGVGEVIAKSLIDRFNSVEEVLKCDPEVLQEVEGVGPILAENIWTYAPLCVSMLEDMKSFGLKFKEGGGNNMLSLKGKIITLTGKGPMGRKELQDLIENAGGTMKGISKNTDILVTNDVNSNSGKMKKAKGYGVLIMDYEQFMAEVV